VEECRELVRRLLKGCRRLRVLVTSRAALELPEEQVIVLPTLPLPPEGSDREEPLLAAPATKLFLDRARAVSRELAVTPADFRRAASICRQLEGWPLAIVLAAAQLSTHSLEEIDVELRKTYRRLNARFNPLPPRQWGLWAALDWSDSQLSAEERHVFATLSQFTGGATREALMAVDGLPEETVEESLNRLVRGSLVERERRGTRLRFRLLEPIREYASRQLGGEALDARRAAFIGYFRQLVSEAEATYHTRDEDQAFDRLDEELGNLRNALAWSRGSVLLELAGSLAWYWRRRGHLGEARRWLESAAEHLLDDQEPHASETARVLISLVSLEFYLTENVTPELLETAGRALGLARMSGDPRLLSSCLSELGYISLQQNALSAARGYLTEALSAARSTNSAFGQGDALWKLAWLDWIQGNIEAAFAGYQESLTHSRSLGDRHTEAEAWIGLGEIERGLSRGDCGRRHFETALRLYEELADRSGVAQVQSYLATTCIEEGRFSEADLLLRKSQAAWLEMGEETLYQRGFPISFARLALRAGSIDAAAHLLGAVQAQGGPHQAWVPEYQIAWEELRQARVGAPVKGTPDRDPRRAPELDLRRFASMVTSDWDLRVEEAVARSWLD
jgi:predicted ATPase